MKKRNGFLYLLIICCVLFCFAFTSCNEEDDSSSSDNSVLTVVTIAGTFKLDTYYPLTNGHIFSIEWELYENNELKATIWSYDSYLGVRTDVLLGDYFCVYNGVGYEIAYAYDGDAEISGARYYGTYIKTGMGDMELIGANSRGEFEGIVSQVSYSYDEYGGGRIEGDLVQYPFKGEDTTSVTAVPVNEAYEFVKWSDGVTTPTRVDKNVTENIAVAAEFKQVKEIYDVTYNASSGGIIEGESHQSVIENKDATTVTAVPHGDFVFMGWSDGVTTATRTDLNVNANIDVTAKFVRRYTVIYSVRSSLGGHIKGETTQIVPFGETLTPVTAVPDEGYRLYCWSDESTAATRQDVVNDELVLTLSTEIKILVTFERVCTLTYRAGKGGRIEGETTQTVGEISGGYSAVQAVADPGYAFVEWSDGDMAASRIDGLWGDVDVTAIFRYVGEGEEPSDPVTPPEDEPSDPVTPPNDEPSNPNDCATLGHNLVPVQNVNSTCTIKVEEKVCSRNCGETTVSYALAGSGKDHSTLKIGDVCADCGYECYVKTGENRLMWDPKTNVLFAEYYGETAADEFDVYASQITGVYISEKVKRIEKGAFARYAIATALFAENSILTEIRNEAFNACDIKEISIPHSVKMIGAQAFGYCYDLEKISIGDDVEFVGSEAFYLTAWLGSQPEGVVYLNKVCYTMKGKLAIGSTVTIVEGTKTVADYAFREQGGLRTIHIPESVTHIGDQAFYNCPALLNIDLPSQLQFIGKDAFSGTAYYNDKGQWENGALYIENYLIKLNEDITGEYIVKEGTRVIGGSAFSYCTLTSVLMPNGVITIGNYAFYQCGNLKSVIISSGITSIWDYAFDNSPYFQIFYEGTQDEWAKISIGNDNAYLERATIYYYSESEPQEEGNYWRYVDGVATAWNDIIGDGE